MGGGENKLRIAFVVGSLAQGGAEKQLLLMLRSLMGAGADVRIYTLSKGEYYEPQIRALGLPVSYVGQGGITDRVWALYQELKHFRPQVVQSTHFFSNLYAVLAARSVNALSVGAVRVDTHFAMRKAGRWGRWLLRLPDVLVVNSEKSREQALQAGRSPKGLEVLANALDLPAFERALAAPLDSELPPSAPGDFWVLLAARLEPQKRIERFLEGLAAARKVNAGIRGLVAGGGPQEGFLKALAAERGLLPGGVTFLGPRGDIPAVLARVGAVALTSDFEGTPNAVLEAFAAGLPVVATPAGDVPRLVKDDLTGYVVPPDDPQALAERLLCLAESPELRERLGRAGRELVREQFSLEALAPALLAIYARAGVM